MNNDMEEEKGKRERLLKGHEDTPLYSIGVASQLLNCEPSTLRRYEKAGLIEPGRSEGKTRLYSENQLERLRDIKELMEEDKVNVSGTRMIMRLRDEMKTMREEMARMKEEIARLEEALREAQSGLGADA